jgi:hypothetical protein
MRGAAQGPQFSPQPRPRCRDTTQDDTACASSDGLRRRVTPHPSPPATADQPRHAEGGSKTGGRAFCRGAPTRFSDAGKVARHGEGRRPRCRGTRPPPSTRLASLLPQPPPRSPHGRRAPLCRRRP